MKKAPPPAVPAAKPARESGATKPEKVKPTTSPELEEARKQVGKLAAKNMQQLISVHTPPEWLVALLEHVLLAYGLTVKSWESLSKELSDVQFVKKVCSGRMKIKHQR